MIGSVEKERVRRKSEVRVARVMICVDEKRVRRFGFLVVEEKARAVRRSDEDSGRS